MGEGIGIGSKRFQVLKAGDHAVICSFGNVKNSASRKGTDKALFLFDSKDSVQYCTLARPD
jgi:hypothetical protein